MIRMRTNSADFCEIVDVQTLTSHSRQFSVFKNAVVMAEFNGSFVKRTRFGESGECNHFFHMCFIQWNNFGKGTVDCAYFIYKLPSFNFMLYFPTVWCCNGSGYGIKNFATLWKQVMKLIKAVFGFFIKARKGRYFLVKEFYCLIADVKGCIGCTECSINRIVEIGVIVRVVMWILKLLS